ncbi:phospholipase A2 group V isoform X1 [Sagmatias obliquidens]|uniref:phospholipase A2 group V isoform X1 n=2 Tax=Sagmatias obliquidens TaxID=3371155 RepID=UPI000F43ECC5|nr:calcium-dependent phospholipase A2 isoform X1 [Lagenorhynchus obliquidens]
MTLLVGTGAEARPERTLEMKGLLTLAWFLACSVPAVPGSLLQLKVMIEKVTRKPALMSYGFYGCYCGWGGQGTPKDCTDWCCWMHDHCYARLEKKGCNALTQVYRYRIACGLVTCGKAGASIQATGRAWVPAASEVRCPKRSASLYLGGAEMGATGAGLLQLYLTSRGRAETS